MQITGDYVNDDFNFIEMSKLNKAKTILLIILKIVGVLASLFFFICSLDIMSQSFRLVGGKLILFNSKQNIIENLL